jgi:hypothetical protein
MGKGIFIRRKGEENRFDDLNKPIRISPVSGLKKL